MTTDPSPGGRPPPPRPPPPPRNPGGLIYKELRPMGGAAGAAVLAAITWSIWTNTGSRLGLFLCASTLAALAVDLVWAQVATHRAEVRVEANPAEAIVGDTLALHLSVSGPRQFLRLALVSLRGSAGGVGADAPGAGQVTGVATAREIVSDVVVEVVSHGLCGLVACARRRALALARPLAVGPRPIPAAEPFPELLRTWGDGQPRPAATGDLVRGVRPYVAGDPVRRVHWRATARAGDLVVKEVEDTAAARLVLVLDLGAGGVAGERAAGRAAWYAGEALRRRYVVVLVTTERGSTVSRHVTSLSELTRRLAAASLPGHPDVPAAGGEGDGVLVVTDRGDSWR